MHRQVKENKKILTKELAISGTMDIPVSCSLGEFLCVVIGNNSDECGTLATAIIGHA